MDLLQDWRRRTFGAGGVTVPVATHRPASGADPVTTPIRTPAPTAEAPAPASTPAPAVTPAPARTASPVRQLGDGVKTVTDQVPMAGPPVGQVVDLLVDTIDGLPPGPILPR
jgi:hypothetical protein